MSSKSSKPPIDEKKVQQLKNRSRNRQLPVVARERAKTAHQMYTAPPGTVYDTTKGFR